MTSRERLVAAARGGRADQQPVISWPEVSEDADAFIVKPSEVAQALEANPHKAVLAEVMNPFGRAVQFRLPLSTLLREEPERGQEELERLVQVTRDDIETAILAGADGIFYRLLGAEPAHSTPMEYGGFYLERDRELLQEVAEARLNVIYVEGGPETYIDFVSDLPAHVFAFQTGDLGSVREMRKGCVAASNPDADVFFSLAEAPVGDLASAHG
jgi:hypothetical protein